MQPDTPLYEIEKLTSDYALGKHKGRALQDVSVKGGRGELVCLEGPSGSGKTTLLSVMGLIEPPQAGKVVFEGKDLGTLSEADKNHLRRFRIGFVFQQFHLIPVLTAAENVEYFLARQGVAKAERRKRVDEALELVGLAAQRAQKPLEMSGGQRQRVALARAMAKRPDVIIADEPTASLDQGTGREVMTLFKELNESRGVTVVLASHDPMVQSFAGRRIRLQDGQQVQS